MAKKSAPPPNSTRSFFLGLIAAAVVVAVALVFVMRRGSQPESGAGSAVDTATQSAPANAPQPATAMPEPTDEQLAVVRRVTVDDVLKEAPKGVVFIDVRESDSYLASHIDGALHIPTSYLMGEAAYLPKDRLIVSYCT